MPLNKTVSLPQAVVYGIGIIVGAGIYTLIGLAAGISGYALWLSFIVAGLIASLTAFSYSELSSRFPKEGAEAFFSFKAFNRKDIAFLAGLIALLSALFSAPTVAWGFASYFKLFSGIEPSFVVAGILILLTIVNLKGMKESVLVENLMTYLTLAGLFLIIIFGVWRIDLPLIMEKTLAENSFSLANTIFSAAALIFFAYLGFEHIANIAEEIKEPKKNTPKAIIYSLMITTALYVLIAIIATSVVSPAELASSADASKQLTQGPLAVVAERAIMPGFGVLLTIFALFATGSTIIALMNVASRILYGFANQDLAPSIFKKLNTNGVPSNAIIFVLAASLLLGFFGNLSLLGNLTTANTFLLFFIVNASLIAIKLKDMKKSEKKHKFEFIEEKVVEFKALPFTAILGAFFCIFMFLTQFWEPINLFGIQIPLILACLILLILSYFLYKKFGEKKARFSNLKA